jgi:hypothetical protein
MIFQRFLYFAQGMEFAHRFELWYSEGMEISQKIRTNGAIGYFFLGFLFLLAKHNPNFSEPFVRAHAKSATKLHLMLAAYVVLHVTLLSQLLSVVIPILSVSLDRVLLIGVFAYVFVLLFIGASRAFSGKEPAGAFSFGL